MIFIALLITSNGNCQVYKERVLNITVNCAHLAAKMSVKKFIEVSTAQVYDSGKVRLLQVCHVSIGGRIL